MKTEQIQKILDDAPVCGATHWVLDNGTTYYLKIYDIRAEIWTENGWLDYSKDGETTLPDLDNISNICDLRKILEQNAEIKRLRDALSEVKRMVEPPPQVGLILKITEQALKGESE